MQNLLEDTDIQPSAEFLSDFLIKPALLIAVLLEQMLASFILHTDCGYEGMEAFIVGHFFDKSQCTGSDSVSLRAGLQINSDLPAYIVGLLVLMLRKQHIAGYSLSLPDHEGFEPRIPVEQGSLHLLH